MNNLSTIREFFINNFLFGDGARLTDETPLFESGIVDSTGILEVISFLEDTYSINIEDHELIADNFSNLQLINTYLSKKLSRH